MAETPNKDIEKLLSDYARQRRDAAGKPELHPATRQMLQAEVKQQIRNATAQPQRSLWSLLWPRFAAACGVIAAIVAVVIIINPPGRSAAEMEMARVDESKSPTAMPAGLGPEAPMPAGMTTDDRSRDIAGAAMKAGPSGEFADKDVASAERSAPALAPVAAPVELDANTRREVTGRTAMKGKADANDGTLASGSMVNEPAPMKGEQAPTSVAAAAQVRADTSAASLKMAKSGAAPQPASQALLFNNALTQRYRNVAYVETAKPNPTQAVLNEFTLEQNGNELKVVDGDGSVYNGYVESTPVDMTTATNFGGGFGGSAQNLSQQVPAYAGQTASVASQRQEAGGGEVRAATQAQQAEGFAINQVQSGNLGQNYYFRVEGTNRSLKERVVFTGNLFNNTLAETSQTSASNTLQFRQQIQVQQAPGINAYNLQLQNNNFINGRVLLGNSRQATELNALSVDE